MKTINIKKIFKGDSVLWIITLLLLLLSIPAVYSASAMISNKSYQGDMHFLVRQIIAVAVALFFVLMFSKISYKNYLGIIKIVFPVVLFLLILTLFSGTSHNNAKRWFELPGIGIEIQTSELAKIALIILVTSLLASKRNDEEIHDKKVKTATWAFVITVGLIFPADLSSALMITAIIATIMFIARVKIIKIYIILLIAVGAIVIYVLMAEVFEWPGRISTWEHRIEVFFGDKEDLSSDETYQLDVAKMAIANGGLWGATPGNGNVRYLLPQSHSDFIFAFIIEEYGLWMAVFIILLYLILFYRGIRIARKTKSLFAAYLALGLTMAIVLQAFINIGVSVGALPVTGQTLPLISMGRTSLLVTSFSLGIIINISRQTELTQSEEL
ncbi:MAG: FtsW/RodA/SpoVE family cell cycle protein [Bacteroidales bacterium]|nr:FtsW/RodA/SpoVE family cell cycle protein [Bacteroidales bacterium]